VSKLRKKYDEFVLKNKSADDIDVAKNDL